MFGAELNDVKNVQQLGSLGFLMDDVKNNASITILSLKLLKIRKLQCHDVYVVRGAHSVTISTASKGLQH